MALPAVADLFKTTFDEPLKKLVQPPGIVPAFVFLAANFFVVYPALLQEEVGFIVAFSKLDAPWQLGLATVLTIALGYVILAFAPSVLRFATGEAWPTSLLNTRLRAVQEVLKNAIETRPTNGETEENARRYELKTRFGGADVEALAPTSLGNVMNAITDGMYSSYRIDMTATWSHLRQAIRSTENTDFLTEIDEDQVGFLSLLNLAAVLALFAIEGLLLALVVDIGSFVVPAAVALFAAYVAYRASVARVASWGERVSAAYDLYRPDLRKLLGIGEPRTVKYERRQWEAMSRALLWDDESDEIDRTVFEAEPDGVVLAVTPNVSATKLSRDASKATAIAVPGGAGVQWTVDYLLAIAGLSKDAKDESGTIEVIDRDLPARLRTPIVRPGSRATARIRDRAGIGLRDTVIISVDQVDGTKSAPLQFALEWAFSISVEPKQAITNVSIVRGATDLRGLVNAEARLTFERGGPVAIAIRDDRTVGDLTLLVSMTRTGGGRIPLVPAVGSAGRWTLNPTVEVGEYKLVLVPLDG